MSGPRARERGSVTAEAAVVLPVLVLLLSVGVGTVGAVAAQLRCIDAAREVARAVARGEPEAAAIALGVPAAPDGAGIEVGGGPDLVVVTVTAHVSIAGGFLPSVEVQGEAVAVPEPTAAGEEVGAPP